MRCLHATLATFEDTTLFAPPPRAGGLDYVRNGQCVLVRFFFGRSFAFGVKVAYLPGRAWHWGGGFVGG